MNTNILQEIGLTDSEIKVYLALLKLGSSKKGPIVKKAGITSSKIYEVIDKLIEKGLASSVIKDKVRYFNAAPPTTIRYYLKEKEEKLKKQEQEFENILPALQLRQESVTKKTDAEIYRGWKGMNTVYNNVLESLKPGETYYVFGAGKGEDEEKVRSFYTRFNERVLQKRIKVNIIFNESARENIPNIEKAGKVRYINQTTPAEILIYHTNVAIVLLEKEPLITLIKGEKIAESFKQYFKTMWLLAKK